MRVTRILAILLITIPLVFAACSSASVPVSAEVEFIKPYKDSTNPIGGNWYVLANKIRFTIKVVPSDSVALDELYMVVLRSKSGYFYDAIDVSWSKEDFPSLEGERDTRAIKEAESRRVRMVTLTAPTYDTELDGSAEAVGRSLDAKGAWGGGTWTSPVNYVSGDEARSIASRYVSIVVVSLAEFEEMVTE